MKIISAILFMIGVMIILSSFFINLEFIGKYFAQDGKIDNILVINYFWVFKAFLFLFGSLFILSAIYINKLTNYLLKNKKELLLLFFALIICLVIIESASYYVVKYNYTQLSFRNKNLSYNNIEYNISANFNSLGFRDEEFSTSKKYMIAIVGDSYVFGDGVEKNQTFEYLLEHELKKKYDDITVYNLGVSGTDLEDYANRVKEFTPILRPNLTILSFYIQNDITCKKDSTFKKVFFPNTVKILKEYFLSKSYSAIEESIIATSNLKKKYKDYLKKEVINPTLVIQAITHPNVTENHRRTQQWFETCKINKDSLIRIKKYSEKYNSKLLILLIPPSYQVSSINWQSLEDLGYLTDEELLKDTTLQKSILTFCSQQKIYCIDLLPELKKSKEFTYFNLDPHFNGIGHELTSKVVLKFLSKE